MGETIDSGAQRHWFTNIISGFCKGSTNDQGVRRRDFNIDDQTFLHGWPEYHRDSRVDGIEVGVF